MRKITSIKLKKTSESVYAICDQHGTRIAFIYGYPERTISNQDTLSPEEAEGLAVWIAQSLRRALDEGPPEPTPSNKS